MDATVRIRRLVVALAAVLAALVPGAPAWAHNSLVEAVPAKNATLTEAPATVKLSFLQKLDPEFTTIVVSDAAQQKVPADPPKVANKTGTLTLTAPLANGDYTVAYQVVSTDGHTVKGSYKFTVAAAAAAPSSAAAPVPAPSSPAPALSTAPPLAAQNASAAKDSGGSGWIWIVVLVVLAGTGLAGFLVVRSRRAS